ncbi:MAG: hypothetical protein LGL72_01935 [Acidibrevibacterium sp.]|jgi:hypothetical protein|uniref:hypothetical protein n=1 Tax=Acidibrevibacterium TaxID=2603324 RepID=UPI001966C07D|nr:hypothetical protein [Acidibrevibacterium fodinaquatile]MCA7118184.1 hypothetical protein [Acidibrevibacterium fodinaquatile]
MTTNLVVVRPFGSYAKGALITDAATIASILASENANAVVRVNATTPLSGG